MNTCFTGEIGERLTEIALLWEDWTPINFNRSIRHTPNVDILAAKQDKRVALQVKTSGPTPSSKAMMRLCENPQGSIFNSKSGPRADFVVFVRLLSKTEHEFYVVPVDEAERVAMATYKEWKENPLKDGSLRKNAPAVIRFELNKNRPAVSNYKEKWAHYRDAWHLLDQQSQVDGDGAPKGISGLA